MFHAIFLVRSYIEHDDAHSVSAKQRRVDEKRCDARFVHVNFKRSSTRAYAFCIHQYTPVSFSRYIFTYHGNDATNTDRTAISGLGEYRRARIHRCRTNGRCAKWQRRCIVHQDGTDSLIGWLLRATGLTVASSISVMPK